MRLYNFSRLLILILCTVSYVNSFAYDTAAVKKLYPGVTYFHITTDEPLSIHLVEADLRNKNIRLDLEIAYDGLNMGGQKTSGAVKNRIKEGVNVIAAVNCDFFGGPGDWQAENSMIKEGVYVKGAKLDRSMMAVTGNNVPYIGDFQFDGYVFASRDTIFLEGLNIYSEAPEAVLYNNYWSIPVKIREGYNYLSLLHTESITINGKTEFAWGQAVANDSTYTLKEDEWLLELSPEKYLKHKKSLFASQFIKVFLGTNTKQKDIYTLFGGLPGLVKDGARPETYIGVEKLTSKRFVNKNPRTAIGYSEDKSKLFMIVADGRQDFLSTGMTLIELSDFMISIGCFDLLNLDGGGSSTMVIEDELINSPSDKTGERPVFNMLLLTVQGD